MKKIVLEEIFIRDDDTGDDIRARIAQDRLVEWCLGLCMLRFDVDELLIIKDRCGGREVRLSLDKRIPHNARGVFTRAGAAFTIGLTPLELEYWIAFFLRYHKDGVADVDHIDVDLVPEKAATGNRLTLTLLVDHARTPLPGDELRRTLGL